MNYREVDVPCYKCEERCVGCHGKCDRYASFDAENKKRREKFRNIAELSMAKSEIVQKNSRRSGKYLRNVYF